MFIFKNAFKKLFILIALILALLLTLIGVAILRTVLLQDVKVSDSCESKQTHRITETTKFVQRLSTALKFRTISFERGRYNKQELLDFTRFIENSFPLVHSTPFITREIVNNFSLLYYVEGSDEKLKPYMLAGHLDVVPVDEREWDIPPFSGVVKDGYIWGRGSMDCKHVVMGILEGLEVLLKGGFRPRRAFYLAFGHDEEVHGFDGARHISKLLKSRNVQLEYLLDEGSMIMDKMAAGIIHPVAGISVSEKGHMTLELSVKWPGGHSSLPAKETTIVILSKALSKLEGDVFPSMFGRGHDKELMKNLAFCATFPFNVVYSNLWLFQPAIKWKMKTPLLNALQRTTVAVTVVSGGEKVNVLPSTATALVNLRIHPLQSISEVFEFMRNLIDDERIAIKIMTQGESHPISPIDSFGYKTIEKSIKQIYNDSCVVPMNLIANTDTRWYLDLTKSIYRFSLLRMQPNETVRFHGRNERISVDNYVDVINFFMHLMRNSEESHTTFDRRPDEL